MSKRKPAKVSKAHSKVTAKAQRARQAVVRSPKPNQVRMVAAGSNKSLSELHEDTRRDTPVLETPIAALPDVENPTMASQYERERTTREDSARNVSEVLAAPVNVGTHQTKPPEITQAMQLVFEFAHRLTQIKTPFEVPGVLSELTIKQFAMFRSLFFPAENRMN
jgi:hypothetical protein